MTGMENATFFVDFLYDCQSAWKGQKIQGLLLRCQSEDSSFFFKLFLVFGFIEWVLSTPQNSFQGGVLFNHFSLYCFSCSRANKKNWGNTTQNSEIFFLWFCSKTLTGMSHPAMHFFMKLARSGYYTSPIMMTRISVFAISIVRWLHFTTSLIKFHLGLLWQWWKDFLIGCKVQNTVKKNVSV